MQLQFTCSQSRCLDLAVGQTQNLEQTQEFRLTDGMPDVGRVIGGWGQPIFRSKEWGSGSVTFSAGMLVWVLYAAEDGSGERVVNTWIPFQSRWELPDGTAEGQIRAVCLPRLVDARVVSPRKLMIRAGMGVEVEAFAPVSVNVCGPKGDMEEIEVLKTGYPIRLRREAGEKALLLDEELTLPESVPKPQSIVYCTMEPNLLDCRVLTDKLVYRGTGNLHMLYRSEEGQYHSWDFEMPFSQVQPLEGVYEKDPRGDIRFGITNLEPELDEGGSLRVKCAILAQYVITDRELVEIAEDAYSSGHRLELERERVSFPAVLETTEETLTPEQTIQAEANLVADARFLPDFPRQSAVVRTVPGTFQTLYYGQDGALHCSINRWEGEQQIASSEGVRFSAVPQPAVVQAAEGAGSIRLRAQVPLPVCAYTDQQIDMITGIQQGAPLERSPDRPSMILERCGTDRLWDIAKRSGSRVSDILRANGLQGEPEPGRMLLIPVP